MSYNGSGVFVVNSAGQPVVASTLITVAAFNAFTADVASGLSNAICKDGQTTVSAHIPFGGYKLTGVGEATVRTDAATLASIVNATGVYCATVGGTADAITLTPNPAITAYAAGQVFWWIASGANTTAVTLAVSGLASPKAVTMDGSTALIGGEILSGSIVGARYDGTRFQLVSRPLTNKLFAQLDVNGFALGDGTLELLKFVETASAVNEPTITNAATGNAPSISATGDDTNISLNLVPKGTGTVQANGANVLPTSGTPQATTSGTSKDFTIPSWATLIHVMFSAFSTNGTSIPIIQLGDAGGIETSGYTGSGTTLNDAAAVSSTLATVGFAISGAWGATAVVHGMITLSLVQAAAFQWLASGALGSSNAGCTYLTGGSKTLSAALTTVRITTTNGTDAFDGGAVNVIYQ